MGCDISAHIEVKIVGHWHHYSCPPLRMWNELFEKIAGVRGDPNNAITMPKGLPNDMSLVTRVCYEKEKDDAHTETWLNKDEMNAVFDWADRKSLEDHNHPHYNWSHRQLGYLTSNSFHLYEGSNPPEITDIRFICWFNG